MHPERAKPDGNIQLQRLANRSETDETEIEWRNGFRG